MTNTSKRDITINEPRRTWSSLKGYVETTYAHITSILGMPMKGCDKTTAEWFIEDNKSGVFATIYDYKVGSTPMGVYEWHIGGQNHQAVALVLDVLNLNPAEYVS